MRLFLAGSDGLVLYEDGDLTQLYNGRVNCIAKCSPTLVVAGTDSGAVVVLENGREAVIGAKDVGESVQGLAVTSKGDLLAGTLPAGLWFCEDGGHTWKELPAFASAPNHEHWWAPWGTPLASAIAAHPKDAKTVFCGVEVGGIFRSRDSGKSWNDLELPCPDVHSIQLSPARPERAYVTTGEGFFCSDDDGLTWREPSIKTGPRYTMGLSAHPHEADRVIISAAAGPPPTWSREGGAGCEVRLSTDGGKRFRTVAKGLEGAVQRKALLINQKVPSEVVFATSRGDLYYSNDGGESFDQMASGLGDVRALVFA